MTWEYLVIPSDQAESTLYVHEILNAHGQAGWEFVETSKKFFIFKRPSAGSVSVVVNNAATETAAEDDE